MLKKILNMVFMIIVLIPLIIPTYSTYAHTEVSGVCEEAITECLIDAILIGVFAGPEAGMGYTLWCGAGYQWCKLYYEH